MNSPTPWRIKTHPMGPEIYDADSQLVVQFESSKHAAANAKLIVALVNGTDAEASA